MLSHFQLVEQEKKKYNKDWITVREVPYGEYIFDLFAFNVKTKKVEIVEVDFGNDTNPEKIKFAETIGKVRVVQSDNHQKYPNQSLIKTIGNQERLEIMSYLYKNNSCSYSELNFKFGGKVKRPYPFLKGIASHPHESRVVYHLKLLIKNGLISKGVLRNDYGITEKGIKVVQFFNELGELNNIPE